MNHAIRTRFVAGTGTPGNRTIPDAVARERGFLPLREAPSMAGPGRFAPDLMVKKILRIVAGDPSAKIVGWRGLAVSG
jgi:hypothetical protein